jgi:hypothetical protein
MPRRDGYEVMGAIAALSPVPRAIVVPAGEAASHFGALLRVSPEASHAVPLRALLETRP